MTIEEEIKERERRIEVAKPAGNKSLILDYVKSYYNNEFIWSKEKGISGWGESFKENKLQPRDITINNKYRKLVILKNSK